MVATEIFVYFHPETLGKWSNLTFAYFWNGLVQPPTRKRLTLMLSNWYSPPKFNSEFTTEKGKSSPLKMDGWKMILSFWEGLFSRAIYVKLQKCIFRGYVNMAIYVIFRGCFWRPRNSERVSFSPWQSDFRRYWLSISFLGGVAWQILQEGVSSLLLVSSGKLYSYLPRHSKAK